MKNRPRSCFSLIVVLISTLVIISCSKSQRVVPNPADDNKAAGPATTSSSATPATANAVHVKYSELCQKENDGKVVSVDGYMAMNSFMVSCSGEGANQRCTLNLGLKPGSIEGHSASVAVGGGPNQMDALPDKYQAEDLHLHASDGKLLGPRDRVRLVAKLSVNDNLCRLEVLEIQTPPADSKPEELEVKAEPVSFANACKEENKDKVISVDGYLGVSYVMICNSRGIMRYCGINLYAQPGTGNSFTANVDVGSEANQMEPLPDQYKPQDLRIHTVDGKTAGFRDRVKVTGKISPGESSCYLDVSEIRKL
jgi:hypothetical protein